MSPTDVTRAEIAATACADTWAGSGELLAAPIGLMATVGARLAKLTFAPDLVLTDGDVRLIHDLPTTPWPRAGCPTAGSSTSSPQADVR
jgi:hypothetical protein